MEKINGVAIIGKDVNGVCGRCKGKGYVNHNFANGVCFWCNGHKSVALHREKLIRERDKHQDKELQYWEGEVANYEGKLLALAGKEQSAFISLYARRLDAAKARLEVIKSGKY